MLQSHQKLKKTTLFTQPNNNNNNNNNDKNKNKNNNQTKKKRKSQRLLKKAKTSNKNPSHSLQSKELAKTHSLNVQRLSSIEFPLNVINVDKALSMVGGSRKIKDNILKNKNLELRLNPNNPALHPIQSQIIPSENILIKVSFPKGELAKYNGNIQNTLKANTFGSERYYKITICSVVNKIIRFRELADHQYISTEKEQKLFSQKINSSLFQGSFPNIKQLNLDLHTTKRPWLPDEFQNYSNQEMNSFHVQQLIKKTNLGLFPIPKFCQQPLPFSFNYKGNSSVIVSSDKVNEKRFLNFNISLHSKLNNIRTSFDAKSPLIPTKSSLSKLIYMKNQILLFNESQNNQITRNDKPDDRSNYNIFNLDPLLVSDDDDNINNIANTLIDNNLKIDNLKINNLDLFNFSEINYCKHLFETIEFLQKKFDEKPIWLTFHLEYLIPYHIKSFLSSALPYVSYSFIYGPWKHAYIKIGYDPRTSPDSKLLQTELLSIRGYHNKRIKLFCEFQLSNNNPNSNQIPKEYEFDGNNLPLTLLFQLENIKDPLIIDLLGHAIINESPNITSGWYDTATIKGVRRILKKKIFCILNKRMKTDFTKKIINEINDKKLLEISIKKEKKTPKDTQSNKMETNNKETDLSLSVDFIINSKSKIDLDKFGLGKVEKFFINKDMKQLDILTRFRVANPKAIHELDSIIGLIQQDNISVL
ncbi:uncharacterized protein ASCRUDRAFT_10170 [Ascoidea rubescens DSM 1968]|uniref:Transcription factor IIIC subunit 5 HTH domain-containing protein n=1 Tax=Ascoidea rubescens DSM 1968 TaxID=1344418 RepID=A0A1D2VAA0_9ASCO|nr:hypothetical protein ASCRUDRAFT_10170 [Ascoidea rubescens DSM 1968]ODV58588.1 hypothetical protein ASCRUDRAFT_10170 [Ascoidea rubescens DSM 1968]